MMKFLLLILFTLWMRVTGDDICCDGLGCFSNDYPFGHLPLPNCHTPTFALFTRNNPTSGEYITRDFIPDVYDGSRRTIFLVHGWGSSENSGWLNRHKGLLLEREDANIVLLGWGGLTGAGNPNYLKSASTTRTVGAEAGLIIDILVSETSATYEQMYCIGHSLGGHLCGHTGRAASSLIGRITGLDPAGPLYENFPDEAGLYSDCASFVDVIHTNGKQGFPMNYGTNKPMGHMDFYPAAGGRQPGCIVKDVTKYTEKEVKDLEKNALTLEVFSDPDMMSSCSHSRAYYYMEESILSDCFHVCEGCSDWQNLPDSCSDCGNCGVMGYAAESAGGDNGLKLVDVVGQSPYCVGECGNI